MLLRVNGHSSAAGRVVVVVTMNVMSSQIVLVMTPGSVSSRSAAVASLIDLAHREPCRSAPCRPPRAAKG